MQRDNLLNQLKTACSQSQPNVPEVLSAIESLLRWLNHPANNTHENCVAIDLFVLLNVSRHDLPNDVAELLGDIGGTLHDAHSAPAIAENFQSTPTQLLQRVQELRRAYG